MRLSDLHQNIRRLAVLAYTMLSAEAREEIACDRFTDALEDPDFALKWRKELLNHLTKPCASPCDWRHGRRV